LEGLLEALKCGADKEPTFNSVPGSRKGRKVKYKRGGTRKDALEVRSTAEERRPLHKGAKLKRAAGEPEIDVRKEEEIEMGGTR